DHARHLGVILALDQRREPINVPGNDMSTKLVANLERPLEIDARAMAPATDRGDPQRFGRGIDRKPGVAILLADADHGHAHARAGNRGAFDNRGALVAAGNLQPMQTFTARAHGQDFPDVGHDAGEHGLYSSGMRWRSRRKSMTRRSKP